MVPFPLFKSRICAAKSEECIDPELAEQMTKVVRFPHSQVNLIFSIHGFEFVDGQGESPWQGALQGCPQELSERISLQAWSH